ncbi:hypothetical protein FRD01_08935 [Microvenator marinus]|uniref:Uncharacterized protein n=1 Tax=Microvenator marinus TaxID=2600177 RepID=A0A5B8XNX7_9DELT|nr:hypothetical protein [Microvenator marinus]QED27360.1 hypothetical protein FRD01_08935 [Microvenator marinus]
MNLLSSEFAILSALMGALLLLIVLVRVLGDFKRIRSLRASGELSEFFALLREIKRRDGELEMLQRLELFLVLRQLEQVVLTRTDSGDEHIANQTCELLKGLPTTRLSLYELEGVIQQLEEAHLSKTAQP